MRRPVRCQTDRIVRKEGIQGKVAKSSECVVVVPASGILRAPAIRADRGQAPRGDKRYPAHHALVPRTRGPVLPGRGLVKAGTKPSQSSADSEAPSRIPVASTSEASMGIAVDVLVRVRRPDLKHWGKLTGEVGRFRSQDLWRVYWERWYGRHYEGAALRAWGKGQN